MSGFRKNNDRRIPWRNLGDSRETEMDDSAWRKGVEVPTKTHQFFDDVQEESSSMGAAWGDCCLRELEVSFIPTLPFSLGVGKTDLKTDM